MTLTKRDLVMRISSETGMIQQHVLDVVQKTLDYIAESLAKGTPDRRKIIGTILADKVREMV